VLLGLPYHALNVCLGQAARGLDPDLLLLAGGLVPGCDVDDSIRVDVEGRHAKGKRRLARCVPPFEPPSRGTGSARTEPDETDWERSFRIFDLLL
jgi:hypothetical protein